MPQYTVGQEPTLAQRLGALSQQDVATATKQQQLPTPGAKALAVTTPTNWQQTILQMVLVGGLSAIVGGFGAYFVAPKYTTATATTLGVLGALGALGYNTIYPARVAR